MASLNSIPQDVLREIASHVTADRTPRYGLRSLRNFALTCRATARAVREYAMPDLRTQLIAHARIEEARMRRFMRERQADRRYRNNHTIG